MKQRGKIPLAGITSVQPTVLPGSAGSAPQRMLEVVADKRSHVLAAESETDQAGWIAAPQRAIVMADNVPPPAAGVWPPDGDEDEESRYAAASRDSTDGLVPRSSTGMVGLQPPRALTTAEKRTVGSSLFLVVALLVGQQLPNIQMQYDMAVEGPSHMGSLSLWRVISMLWNAEAKVLAFVLALWSGCWLV